MEIDLDNETSPQFIVKFGGQEFPHDAYDLSEKLNEISKEKGESLTYDDMKPIFGVPGLSGGQVHILCQRLAKFIETMNAPGKSAAADQDSPSKGTAEAWIEEQAEKTRP